MTAPIDTLRRLVIGSPEASYALYQACGNSAAEVTMAMQSYDKLCAVFRESTDLTRLEVAQLVAGAVE